MLGRCSGTVSQVLPSVINRGIRRRMSLLPSDAFYFQKRSDEIACGGIPLAEEF